MRLRLVHARVWLLVLLLAVVGLASVQLAAAPALQPKRASFDISNAFTVKVPEGAKRVRVWFDEGGSEVFPPDVITVLAPPPQLGKGGKLPVVPPDDET